ncbi:PREDICTED: chymotrypsin B-like [Branchiostoma belcheri]|uniref:Chymotrypsin B-like n=1 Tax=Branchiostoma belcheri TaxID=7741 RepID=A0A6P4ZYC9_BRABE|nr:PREDICTED: chymotrypsin B-like [Branchiostoma belcheri]
MSIKTTGSGVLVKFQPSSVYRALRLPDSVPRFAAEAPPKLPYRGLIETPALDNIVCKEKEGKMCRLTEYLVAATFMLHLPLSASQWQLSRYDIQPYHTAPSPGNSDNDCGGTLDTMSGDLTITSPLYPSNYPPSKLCIWHVTASVGKIVVITFQPYRMRCNKDFVAVFDGGAGSNELIEGLCTSLVVRGLRTTTNQMTVVFKSNGGNNDSGFTATITEVDPYGTCGSPTIARIPAPERIVGGNTAQQGSWPWQVLVRNWVDSPGSGGYYLCGGTLVDAEWVVTAAHCIHTPISNIEVTLGEHDRYSSDGNEVSRFASQTFLHPSYAGGPYDIALIKFASPVTFNDYIMPICLPSSSDVLLPGTMVSVSGWGITSYGGATARFLQQMVVPVVSDPNCQMIYGSGVLVSVDMCAGYFVQGGIDSCSGDSGGPLSRRSPTTGAWELHGAVSRGVPCAHPFFPTMYARVTGLVDWLTTTMANN